MGTRHRVVALAAAVVLAMPVAARAADRFWQTFGVLNEFWDDNANWSPALVPGGGDHAFLVGSHSANTSVLHYNPALTVPTLGSLTLDQTGGGRIDFRQHEWYPHDFKAANVFAGLSGFATYEHRAGTSTLGTVNLGHGSGGSGTYSLVNGSSTVPAVANVTNMLLGATAGSRGFADVWNAYPGNPLPTLNVQSVIVGRSSHSGVANSGEGWFSQTGGNVYVSGRIVINSNFAPAGGGDPLNLYGFYGGTLVAQEMEVGHDGYGRFSLSSGSSAYAPGNATFNGDITLGYYAGRGVLEIGAAHALSARNVIAGQKGTGQVTHRDTATASFMRLHVGLAGGADNTYLLRDSAVLRVAEETSVGRTGRGTFTQTGGTHDLTFNGATGSLRIGQDAGGDGTYLLRNVTNNLATALKATHILVGEGGVGAFRHDGGQVTATNVYVGHSAGGSGTWTVEGVGSVTGNNTYATRLITTNLYVGYSGNGTFDQTTSEPNFVQVNQLYVGYFPGSTGTYNLGGGTITFTGASGRLLDNRGTFNMTAGTISSLTTLQNGGTFRQTGGGMSVQNLVNGGTFDTSRSPAFSTIVNQSTGTLTSDGGKVTTFGLFTNDGEFTTKNTPNPAVEQASVFQGNVVNTGRITVMPGTAVLTLELNSPAASSALTGKITVDGGKLSATTIRQDSLTITGTAAAPGRLVMFADDKTSVVNHFDIAGAPGAWLGRADLANGRLVVDYDGDAAPYEQFRRWIAEGAIYSVVPNAPRPTIVAPVDNQLIRATSWEGLTFGGPDGLSQLLLATTYPGDGNLDGTVTQEDYASVVANMGRVGSTYIEGDLTLDGVVGQADFDLVTANLGAGSGGGMGVPMAALTAVPEPGILVLPVVAAAGLSLRRRRFE